MTQGDLPPLPPQHPGGFIWEPHAGRMRIVTDAEWGNLASTLLPSVQQAAARLANRQINGANRRPDLCDSAELLTTLLAGEMGNIAANAPAIYMESIFLGETMAADTALRQSPDPIGEPLSDEMRAALAALMRGLPAFVRSFPTVQAMDDHNAAFFAEVVQAAPVQRLTDAAEANKVIDPVDSAPLRRGLQTGWEAGPFHQRGPRASQTSMRNLVLAAVVAGSAAVSAGFLGEIGAAVNRGLGLPHKIENWTKQSKDDLQALFQTAPADITQAVLLHLDALGKAPPVQPPEPPSPKGRTWIVDPKPGRGDFTMIQPAIDAAADGDRIVVREGTYRESLRLSKALELIGEGDVERILVTTDQGHALLVDAPLVRVSGLSFKSEGRGGSDCVWISSGMGGFDFCIFESAERCGVVVTGGTTRLTLRHCQLRGSAMDGASIQDQAKLLLEDCQVIGNKDCGIWVQDQGTHMIAARCVLERNARYGVYAGSGARVGVDDCRIVGNMHAGIWVQNGGSVEGSGNKITANGASAIIVRDNSTGTFRNNDLRGNAHGPWDIAEGATIIDENNLT